MEQESPSALARQLERKVAGIVSNIDPYVLEAKPRALILSLKRQAIEARLDVRDYEYAETRQEQLRRAHASRERLEALRRGILTVSECGVFSAVDVVQLSAWIDNLVEHLE